MKIETLQLQIGNDPFFNTNCYILSSATGSGSVVVVDPADKIEQILAALKERTVAAIVLTHRHDDHTAAAAQLARQSGAPVYAHAADAEAIERPQEHYPFYGREQREAPKISRLLSDGDVITEADLHLEVLHTPGHSAGSICLLDAASNILFSGDTLFFGTCGRTDFASGSPLDMHNSLARLALLPPETKVYPGHEHITSIGDELGRGLSEY